MTTLDEPVPEELTENRSETEKNPESVFHGRECRSGNGAQASLEAPDGDRADVFALDETSDGEKRFRGNETSSNS